MLIESKLNPKQPFYNETVRLVTSGRKVSLITQSLDRDNYYFIYRYWSFRCVKVIVDGNVLKADLPLNTIEKQYFDRHVIRSLHKK
jgi:hypothetical protein